MEEFPSGQRGQTVNLLLLASVVRIHPPPPEKGLCILQSPFFCEITSFGICEIYLRYSEKTTYGCCEMRCGAWDLFHFTWCVASNFTSAVALISHFASAKYFTKISLKLAKYQRTWEETHLTSHLCAGVSVSQRRGCCFTKLSFRNLKGAETINLGFCSF